MIQLAAIVASINSYFGQLQGGFVMSFQSKLSKREFQVLELVSSGSSNSQVAETLGISRSTAKTHLRNIYSKTDHHNRTILAISFLNSKT